MEYMEAQMQRLYDGADEEQQSRAVLIGAIITNICELPDRTSPEDQPDMMLVTAEELDLILRRHLFGEE